MIKSPCKSSRGKISCTTGVVDDVCKVCFRSFKEVCGWLASTEEEKEAVMINVEKRRAKSDK